jgi:hypothetical protein
MTEKGIKKLIRPKSDFAVFRAIKPQSMRAHFPARIATELEKRQQSKPARPAYEGR